jgi:hypothetical protein
MSEKHAGWAREREELFGRVVLWPGRGRCRHSCQLSTPKADLL